MGIPRLFTRLLNSLYGLCLAGVMPPMASGAPAMDLNAATQIWGQVLAKHVHPNGGVNYQSLEQDQAALDSFLAAHQALNLAALSEESRKALYINLYNAGMIHNLLRHAKASKIDTASPAFTDLKINDIKTPGGNIWNGDYKLELAGFTVSLDDIEHGLIRGRQKLDAKLAKFRLSSLDPRIHAAVNCAAMSCPRLRVTPYTADKVDVMLDENMREYMTSEAQFSKKTPTKMHANQIVYWYYSDFDDYGRDVLGRAGAGDYLSQFFTASMQDKDWKMRHLKEHFNDRNKFSLRLSSAFDFHYDWRVNDVRNVL